MRPLYLLVVLATSAATGLAQDDSPSLTITLLPNCAQVCLVTAIFDSPCELTNTTCICTNTKLQGVVSECVTSSCSVRESLTTKNVTMTACHAPVRSDTTHLRLANLILCCASAFCVIVRYVHQTFFSAAGVGWDDYSIVVTIMITIPSIVIIDRGLLHSGIGHDIWTVPFDDIENFVKWLYTLTIFYLFQSAIMKITLLLFFLRIFPRRRTRQLLLGTIAFIAVCTLAFVIPAIIPCLPLRNYWTAWDKSKPTKRLNMYVVMWVHAITCIIVDIWMISIPLFEVFHLQMTLLKKCGVALMFSVGAFVTAVSILRSKSLIDPGGTDNATWDQTRVLQWSVYELNVGMMCTCMPALRLAFVRVFRSMVAWVRPAGRSRIDDGTRVADENSYWGLVKGSKGSGDRCGGGEGMGYGTELTGDTLASVGTGKGSVFVVGVDDDDGEGGGGGGGSGIRCTKAFGIRHEAEEDEDELVPLDDFAGKMDRQRERERERERERGDSQSEASL